MTAGTPPDDWMPSLEAAKRRRRVPRSSRQVRDELALEFLVAQEQRKAAAEREDEAKRALLAAGEDAEELVYSTGRFTFYEQTTKAHEVRESTYRVLRHKPNKQKV